MADLPAPDIDVEAQRSAVDRNDDSGIGWPAVVAAALAHALLLALLLVDWHHPPPLTEPKPIPVALLIQPPAPPPASPQPTPSPKQSFRESGPDQETTALPEAKTPAPQPEALKPPPPPPLPPPEPNPTPAPPLPAVKPPPPPVPQEAQLRRAPRPALPHEDRTLGEAMKRGDPYLNQLWELIQSHRPRTTPVGPAGLHLEGISVFAVEIERSGALERIQLVQSSGAPQLDDQAQHMILAAAPFPPLPPDYPDHLVVAVTLHLFPE